MPQANTAPPQVGMRTESIHVNMPDTEQNGMNSVGRREWHVPHQGSQQIAIR